MKFSIAVLLFFLLPFLVEGQGMGSFIPEKTIPLKADFFTVDNLGSIYTVKADQLLKFNSDYNQVNTFSSKLLGNITAIDVNNPMKLVLFYKNLSQLVFLDNTLSQQGEPVALEKLGMEQATLVCSSVNNGLWLYDQRNFQLVRLDQNLKIITETGNIIQQTGGELQPNFLIEKNNWVYLNDTERGILVFDIFGTYSKTIPLKNLRNFQVIEDILFFEKAHPKPPEGRETSAQTIQGDSGNVISPFVGVKMGFFSFSMKTLEQKEIPLPATEFKQLLTDGKKIFILRGEELIVYMKEN